MGQVASLDRLRVHLGLDASMRVQVYAWLLACDVGGIHACVHADMLTCRSLASEQKRLQINIWLNFRETPLKEE